MQKEVNEKNKISAFLIAHNEEDVIETCLKSLKGNVDEIIVIHDGPCSDKSMVIAGKYADKVIESKEWKGIGESHYIQAFHECSYPWILRIDPDEYLSEELANHLHELTSNENISAYNFIWQIWDGENYISKNWPYKIFLFQKSKIGFIDIYHHPIIVYGEQKNIPMVMHHKPTYNNYTNERFKKKIIPWAHFQAKDFLDPIESKENYNIKLEDLKAEKKRKEKFYRYPLVCFVLSFGNVMIEGLRKPTLLLQKGFWFNAIYAGRYTYNVAKEVNRLKSIQVKSNNG